MALTHATEIRAVLDNGDEALHGVIKNWRPAERKTLARAAVVGPRSSPARPA
jgi:hypothetical protein